MAICLPAISIMSEFNFIVQFHTKLTVFMHLKDILLFTKYRSEISAQDSLLNILNSYITAMQSISSKAFTKCIHKCIISFQFKGSLTKQYSGKLTQYFRNLCLYLKCLKQKKMQYCIYKQQWWTDLQCIAKITMSKWGCFNQKLAERINIVKISPGILHLILIQWITHLPVTNVVYQKLSSLLYKQSQNLTNINMKLLFFQLIFSQLYIKPISKLHI